MGDLDEYGPEVKPLARARKRLIKANTPKARKRRAKKAIRIERTAPARAALAAKRAAAPRDVEITLTMPHSINGESYGPGVVRVSQDLAAVFAENEQRVRQNDADMMSSGRAAFIGPRGKRIPVPYGSMDSPNLAMIEAFSL
jgi:hypothetical protein